MLFDVRRIRVRSLAEFGREYLMIVVGILTALGLEHVVRHSQELQRAAESRSRIVAELRQNLVEVRHAGEENERRQERLQKIQAAAKTAIQDHASPAEAARRISAITAGGLMLGFEQPSLRHEAWDVAVADQSLVPVDPQRLRRYSAAYAAQRDFAQATGQGGLWLMIVPRTMDVLTDLDLGRVEPVEFLKVANQMNAAMNSVRNDLKELQAELEKDLHDEPAS